MQFRGGWAKPPWQNQAEYLENMRVQVTVLTVYIVFKERILLFL